MASFQKGKVRKYILFFLAMTKNGNKVLEFCSSKQKKNPLYNSDVRLVRAENTCFACLYYQHILLLVSCGWFWLLLRYYIVQSIFSLP